MPKSHVDNFFQTNGISTTATEPKDPAEENAMEDIDEECVMILKSTSYPSFLYPDENNFYFKSSKPLSTHLFPLTVVKVLKTGS